MCGLGGLKVGTEGYLWCVGGCKMDVVWFSKLGVLESSLFETVTSPLGRVEASASVPRGWWWYLSKGTGKVLPPASNFKATQLHNLLYSPPPPDWLLQLLEKQQPDKSMSPGVRREVEETRLNARTNTLATVQQLVGDQLDPKGLFDAYSKPEEKLPAIEHIRHLATSGLPLHYVEQKGDLPLYKLVLQREMNAVKELRNRCVICQILLTYC
ncbi:hypothetical protein BC835DRAFT_1308459 [Cytidiella melzeri]|nr:hypothetical protein BC835DRAFT_1308459 [Cytidiella melzeri]